MRKRLLFGVAVLGMLSASAQGFAQETVTLKLSANDRPDGHVFLAGKILAERVEDRTGGRLKIELFPNHTLAGGSFKTEMELLRAGIIDLSLLSTIIAGLFVDRRFDVFSLPFLIDDHEVAIKVIDGPLGDATASWYEEYGIKALGIGINGFPQLTNSKRPVATAADIKGLKLRVAGTEVFLAAFKTMEAQAVTMNMQETFQALQTRAVDGQENAFSTIMSFRLYEVQDYVTQWNYVYDPFHILMNKDKFDSLSEEFQTVLLEEGRNAVLEQRAIAIQQDIDLPAELEKLGMEVLRPTPEAIDEFRQLLQPLYSQFNDVIGADIIALAVSEAAKARAELGR